MSTTTNITLEKPANGSDINTWDVPLNSDFDIIDQAIGGATSLNVVAASGVVALTVTQYRSRVFSVTGLLTAAVNYQLPTGVGGFWFVRNATTGAFALTFSSAGGGSTLVLTQGTTTALTSDGTNIRRADTNSSAAGGSDTQILFNSSGTIAGSPSLTWNGSAVTAPTFVGALTGAATSVGNLLTVNNGNAGSASGVTFNGSAAITISRNTIGAAASGTNTDITALNASGGVVSGSPTGGAKGTGTINAAALYVNGLAVSAGSGAVSSVNASGGTTGLSFSGGPITTSGTLTLAGTLATANGGTALTSFTSGGAVYATSTSALATGTLPTTAGGTGITSLGAGVATWMGTPSSANLAAAVTDETGSGALVFGTAPTISNPTFTGVGKFADGAVGAPSITFTSEATTGLYRIGATDLGITVGGTKCGAIIGTSTGTLTLGYGAGGSVTGAQNVAIGTSAGAGFTSNTNCVAIGYQAGNAQINGGATYIGSGAGVVATGANNTCIGYGAGSNITSGAANVTVGNGATISGATSTNEIVIGQSVVGQGTSYVTIGSGSGKVYCAYTASATWTQTSDERLKQDIQTDPLGLDFINALRPVTFRWMPSADGGRNTETVIHGLIAQEVKTAMGSVGCSTFNGWDIGTDGIQGVSREMFITPLIKAVQELSARVAELEGAHA